MTDTPLAAVLRHIRQMVPPPTEGNISDAVLLCRFTRQRDPDAFALLVRRYGPLVWRVCRRVLAQADAAEDAFQATFLVFARRAGSLRKPESLAAFLHGIAYHVARRARAEVRRRPPSSRLAESRTGVDPSREAAWRELGQIIEEEVHRLPETLRAPLLLCYWQGQTNEEAARSLGWPCGTVKTRLAKARRLLHERLSRRGVTLPAGGAALLLAPGGSDAAMPRRLLTMAADRPAGVPAGARALAEGALHATPVTRLKLLLALALTLGAAAGAGGLVFTAAPAEPPAAEPPTRSAGRDSTLGRRAADPLPEGAIARLGTTRFRHSGWVWHLAFAPDGKTLAAGGVDEVVRFWDVKTGRQARVSPRFGGIVDSLAFSPDGGTLAVSDSHAIYLLDAATGQERRFADLPPAMLLFPGIGGGTSTVAFAPDGKTLASTTPSGEVALYDPDTLRQSAVLGKHDHPNVPRLVFSPDGRTLASSGQDVTIRLWDVVRRKALFVLRSEDTMAFPIVFSRDGKWLISGGGTQEAPNDWRSPWKNPAIRIWDVATGKQVRVLKDTDVHGCICSLALAPDGRTLAASYEDTLRLWDLKEGKPLRSLPGPRNHYQPVAALQFSPDGKLLAGSIGNTVALWETASGRLLNLDPNESGSGIHSVAVSGNGRLLATGDGDGALSLWDFRTRRLVRRFRGHSFTVKKVVFSPDDKTLASISENDCCRLWDVANGRQRYQFPADPPKDCRLTNLAFSPDGKFLASAYFSDKQGGGPRGIHLLDAATGEERQNLTIGDAIHGWFVGIGFSPDGRHLTGTTVNGETYGWRREADRFVEKGLFCHLPNSHSVVYSPDGFLSMEKFPPTILSFRDLDTGKPKRDLSGLLPLGNILAFSRDGRYFAAGPYLVRGGDRHEPRDNILHVCEMASGQEVLRWRLPPHTGVHALAFAPDDRTLIAGMTDTTVLLWNVFPAARPAADDLPAIWADLDSGDARRAHRALAWLIAAGDEGVAFLAHRLQPIHPPAPEQLARWIADLDSDTFAVREKAMRALSKAAETARPALVRARAGSPPLERRRRIDLLLEEIDNPAPSAAARAIAALEYLGTPAARRLLQWLGEGAPEARRTREARAACRRLARIPAARP